MSVYAASKEDQMAAVLAVKACAQSTPYDAPPWLAPVLVALLRASRAPQPLRGVVRCVPLQVRLVLLCGDKWHCLLLRAVPQCRPARAALS